MITLNNDKNTKKNISDIAVSKSTAQRLPYYLRTLRGLLETNEHRVSSTELAHLMNITASQVRHDLSSFGGFGLKGYGYDVQTLYTTILDIACVRDEYSAVILGNTEMITMLTSRPVFIRQGVALKKTFVSDNLSVLEKFEAYCMNNSIDIIVLATDGEFTTKAVDVIKKLNIKGVWNFSDKKLDLKIPVKNIWIDDSLMTLCYEISKRG